MTALAPTQQSTATARTRNLGTDSIAAQAAVEEYGPAGRPSHLFFKTVHAPLLSETAAAYSPPSIPVRCVNPRDLPFGPG
eukprot:s202_g20.t2